MVLLLSNVFLGVALGVLRVKMTCITCHMSHVTRHTSHVTRHTCCHHLHLSAWGRLRFHLPPFASILFPITTASSSSSSSSSSSKCNSSIRFRITAEGGDGGCV